MQTITVNERDVKNAYGERLLHNWPTEFNLEERLVARAQQRWDALIRNLSLAKSVWHVHPDDLAAFQKFALDFKSRNRLTLPFVFRILPGAK